MKKYLKPKKLALFLLSLLVLIQFISIDTTVVPIDPAKDFISLKNPDAVTSSIIKKACYDCHSNQPKYPWYSQVAPVSWWIKHHINEGREHLNFSEWATYTAKKANHKLEECVEMLKESEMPLSSYTWAHSEAKLSPEQRNDLAAYFNSQRAAEVME